MPFKFFLSPITFLLLSSLILIAGCESSTPKDSEPSSLVQRAAKKRPPGPLKVIAQKAAAKEINSGREAAAWLSEAEASARAERIKNIHYTLQFNLDAKSEEFQGLVKLQFELSESAKPITIDFEKGTIESITDATSGAAIAYHFKEHFIVFDKSTLKEGVNAVSIKYHRPYSKSGDGFYRFQDPEDHQVYLYTDFEPYMANGLFPCFDQPNLKATYQLTVTAPKEWVVVSNTRETKIEQAALTQTWIFPVSQTFSTYLFSLIAGPFHVWSDQAGEIPIRLLVRKSLAKYVLHEDWLTITKQGLEFYPKYFDYKYPFGKYDQILVPDFNAGAMENVGSVTFSERYIKRGIPTDIDRENLSVTVLHEMAHMWFGDLVTMKWWNGLWLNESFATFMSYMATEKATRFKSVWESFHLKEKQWGYREDQFVTTHPIETKVESTDVATSNFDGISYAKGASVLKQLNYFLTPEKFQRGVQAYFKKYAFQNTTIADFFGSLSEASGQDLGPWASQWLTTAGLNSVRADFDCKDGKVAHLILHQSGAAGFLRARVHRISIGMIQAKPLQLSTLDFVLTAADVEVPGAKGLNCPDLVYPNVDDYAYIKVDLDAISRKNIVEVLSASGPQLSSLLRSQLWTTYFDSVRDGKTPAEEYMIDAAHALNTEQDERISLFLLTSLVQERGVSNLRSALFYLHNEASQEYWKEKLETNFRELLKRKTFSSDLRKAIFDAYLRIVVTDTGLEELASSLQTAKSSFGFELDQDRRWSAITELMRNEFETAPQLLEREKKRDLSHSGKLAALSAMVVIPKQDIKNDWLETFRHDPKLSAADVLAVSQWMLPDEQMQITHSLFPKIRLSVDSLAEEHDVSFVHNAVRGLIPVDGATSTIEFLQSWWNQDHDWLPAIVERALRVAIQENEITRRNRAVSTAYAATHMSGVKSETPKTTLSPAPALNP